MKLVKHIIMFCLLASLAGNADAKMFGTNETESSDITSFTKWNDVIKRHESFISKGGFRVDEWNKKISEFKEITDKSQQLAAVNKYINSSIKYKIDQKVWNKSDYWASPIESFSKGYGDCDDYAIAKYFLLKELGFEEKAMRVVVLRDNEKNEIHAVLAVLSEKRYFILDNQFKDVKPDSQIPAYEPIYSINQVSWWRHG
ncbi:MAG: hypothetical protein COV36_06690 [Alphaproteobacteria bacterium CG11_big_fil_rev_8_21_14_0_20_44_7]|nr:MAG: hypothetical protein COV36_06690 [Alphaproteobacteria bacterium CG11_big_fil_rev_8_21_14_0_20_44_7]